MKGNSIIFFAALLAVGGAAFPQSGSVRAQRTPTAVTPAQPPQTVPATRPPVTVATPRVSDETSATPPPVLVPRRVGDSATEVVPDRNVSDRRNRVVVDRKAPSIPRAPELAAVWQPLNGQVEVFSVDAHGVLKGMWKHELDFWEPSYNLSGPYSAPAGAPVAAVWQPLNEQLEVFTVTREGQLLVAYKAHNAGWNMRTISDANYARPGAHLAAVFQPLNNQLEVFSIDETGAVRVTYKEQNGLWHAPTAITPPASAPPGAPLTAVFQPLNAQLEVFWIDPSGALRGVLKQQNGHWQSTFALSAPGFAYPHAKVTAVWHSLNEQLEVFAIDRRGGVNVIWKAHNGQWFAPYLINGPDVSSPTGDVLALWDPQAEVMQVVTVSTRGRVNFAFKIHNGAWKPGAGPNPYELAAPGSAGNWPYGSSLAGVVQPFPFAANRFLAFTVTDNQAVNALANNGTFRSQQQTPITRDNFSPIYATHTAYCTRILKSWSRGNDLIKDETLQGCQDYLQISAYCKSQDAFVGVGYQPQGYLPRFLMCSKIGHADDLIDQAQHIATGVGQGLWTAAVTTIAYAPEIVQGYGCIQGVVFACATLAVDLGARTLDLPPELKDAVDLANDATRCVNEDVIACVRLGAAAARAVDIPIPGSDASEVASLTIACAHQDYGACLRLGEKGAMAAGIPIDKITGITKNAQDCYAGVVSACIALSGQALPPGNPVAEAQEVAALSDACIKKDYGACQRLVEKGARAANIPLQEIAQHAKNAQACYANDIAACLALGRQAAAANIPVGGVEDGVETLRQCQAGSVPDCQLLGQAIAQVPR
jgi:hypothetical protein